LSGAGAISRWVLELQTDGAPRTFDYGTIADVVLHIRYTAREDQGGFKLAAIGNLNKQLKDASGRLELRRIFRVPNDFAASWAAFRNPSPGSARTLELTLDATRFLSLAFDRTTKLRALSLLGHSPMSAPSVNAEIGVPPLPAKKLVPLAPDPDDDHYFAAKEFESFGPTALTGPVTWSFQFKADGGEFKQFDPKVIDDLYLIIAYTLE
jgi:hypothetical protein